ncbi:hypothetical protein PVAP13_8NG277602 [Panicum virgatum]|uniref:PGG domain-containing protein n=2 Tax=Panicum virgatum TaxID=38727 RepID=A0A8T0PHE4_PANVG|nr:hypothetical protein PVAP13_8NG277602 [Panicum virgatum]
MMKRRRKVLMLLAIFATTITYTAGLNPPGAFWPKTQDGHRAGDPAMQERHRGRFLVFFVLNTLAFVASVGVIMLLLTNQFNEKFCNKFLYLHLQYVCIGVALVSLAGAYAAGTCRKTDSTTSVVVLYLCSLALVLGLLYHASRSRGNLDEKQDNNKNQTKAKDHSLSTARSLVLLLATLAAAVTYQAGLNPPGGFWPDDRDGHKGGDPILLAKHATRYRVFFYCNSTALAASLVVIFMVQRNCLSKRTTYDKLRLHALQAVMILDLIALIGAYAAGCCRDTSTSIYVIALAGGVLVYVVFHLVFFTMHRDDLHEKKEIVERDRKLLLMLAILATTLTYQAGLTPPGGFWLEDDNELGHRAGDPVLLSNYPRRYTAFFYLNATGFMASVALTVLLVNPNLYRAAIRSHALCVCMVAGLFGLMGAYAAGSSRHLRTSIYMIALIGLVFTFITLLLIFLSHPDLIGKWIRRNPCGCDKSKPPNGTEKQAAANPPIATVGTDEAAVRSLEAGDGTTGKEASLSRSIEAGGGTSSSSGNHVEPHTERRYLVLLGVLAASVTYQAGLVPPGGFWPDNRDGHAAGNPILHDSNDRRYHIFFCCNSISFAASIAVIALLMLELVKRKDDRERTFLIRAAHYMMLLDLVGLLGAYAAGSSREWETSGYIVALVAAVPLYIGVHIFMYWMCRPAPGTSG